jgi:hypothetical protein
VKSLKFRDWGSLVAKGSLKSGFAARVILAVDRDLSAKKKGYLTDHNKNVDIETTDHYPSKTFEYWMCKFVFYLIPPYQFDQKLFQF